MRSPLASPGSANRRGVATDLLAHAGLHDACGAAARDYIPGVFSIPPTRGAAATDGLPFVLDAGRTA
jgi:hypothetical protein